MSMDQFDPAALNAVFAMLRREAEEIVRLAGQIEGLSERRFVDMRYRGQGHELNVEIPAREYTDADASTYQDLFNLQYRRNYGRTIPNLGVEGLTWTLMLSSPPMPSAPEAAFPDQAGGPAAIDGSRQIFDVELGGFVAASVIRRDSMRPGSTFVGPAIITEDQTTTHVPSGYVGTVSSQGHLVLKRHG